MAVFTLTRASKVLFRTALASFDDIRRIDLLCIGRWRFG
jgi:hypothetical protein